MGSGNEPAGQQAMTSERLAEIKRRLFQPYNILGEWDTEEEATIDELLSEVERLRAALDAKADSYERLHRINELIIRQSRAREAALVVLVERVATMLYIPLTDASGVTTRELCGGCARTFRRDDSGWFSEDSRHAPECVVEQARALLASTKADVG